MSEILDSGSRTEFESGAVRDEGESKGRCDLMPLSVISKILGYDTTVGFVPFITDLNVHKREIARRPYDDSFLYLALHHLFKESETDIVTIMLRLSQHFEKGAKKYGEYNWQKGIPVHSYINSAVRHYLKWKRGDTDEDHFIACVWNIVCAIWTISHRPECNDWVEKDD